MRDRTDSHARDRAVLIARQDPPPGVSPDGAVAAVCDVLDTIGDTLPGVLARGMSTLDAMDILAKEANSDSWIAPDCVLIIGRRRETI